MWRFFRNRSGNVALIFALALIPITLVVGVSVDLSRMRGERTKLQSAVDAAALAAANLPSESSDQVIANTVEDFLEANFAGLGDIGTVTITRTGSAIQVDAQAEVPMVFAGLAGYDTKMVGAMAEATRSFSYFEVVMVLDNSGSMDSYSGYTKKIEALRTAATSLVTTLADAEQEEGSVKIGLVPFTLAVNVGSQYDDASWMDYNSLSPEHDAMFGDGDGNPVDVNRFDLFQEMGVSWAGCVDTRAYPLDVTDVEARQSDPDSLIVPYFAPDEPDTQGYSHWSGDYDIYPNNYLDDFEPGNEPVGEEDEPEVETWSCTRRWTIFGYYYECTTPSGQSQWSRTDLTGDPAPSGGGGYGGGGYGGGGYGGGGYGGGGQPDEPWWEEDEDLNSQNAKEDRQGYAYKYGNDWEGDGSGPNANCNVKPLMPMTNNFDALETAIDDMDANGYTNITQGTMWGWRLLSPEEPFSEGAEYDDPDTRKFLIVLTDGENNIPSETGPNHNKSIYSPYGYAQGGRLGNLSSQNQIISEMDDRLEEICENVKDTGITVYTIAFAINDDDLEDMMRDCASNPERYFDSPDAASLQATFEAIVNDITQLRLSQ